MPQWLITALATLGPAAISAITQIFEAKKAAGAITSAADAASAAQLAMFGTGQAALQPYLSGGAKALGVLDGQPATKAVAGQVYKFTNKAGKTVTVKPSNAKAIAAYTKAGWTQTQKGHVAVAAKPGTPGALEDMFMKPIVMDQTALEQTPGYKFQLAQGLKSGVSALTARGLGPTSGAAVKGAETYAEGLASENYQQQFSNALANKNMAWTALYGEASLGEGAGTGVAREAATTGTNIGANITNAGAAAAGSDVATMNAVTGFGNVLTAQQLAANQRNSGQPPNPQTTQNPSTGGQ